MSLLLALTLATAASAAPADQAVGLWRNPKGSLTVRTRRCGPQLCATVVSASDKAKAKAARAGVPKLVGTEIFSNYRRDGSDWRGTLYLPDRGMRVASRLETGNGRSMKIAGCVLGGMLCKAQVWTRVDGQMAGK